MFAVTESMSDIIERQILDIVKSAGDKGVLQRDIWNMVKIDSRRGIKIIKRLERYGLITRESYIYKGRKTYILRPTSKVFKEITLPVFLDSIPCFFCPLVLKCSSGDISTSQCQELDRWLESDP